MKTFIKFVLICLLCVFSKKLQAQEPSWSLNESDYQYSMVFTAFLSVDGEVLTSPNDQVGAFVNDELRGVSNVEYISSLDKYIVYLTVFSNTNNETINFKIYDSNTEKVKDAIETEIFVIDGSQGGVLQSYSISTSKLNNEAVFDSFGFQDVTPISTEIVLGKINIVLPENTDLANLTPVFTSSDNSKVFVDGNLQVSGDKEMDFNTSIVYEVLSEDETNLNKYEVFVTSYKPISVVVSSLDLVNVNEIPVSLEVSFSDVVSGFDTSDVLLENAIITSITTSDNKSYVVDVIPLEQGEFSIQIMEGAVMDGVNTPSDISNKSILNYDIMSPVITDVSLDSEADSWKFKVLFSEEVLDVDLTSIQLIGEGSAELELLSIEKESETEYSVTVSNTSTLPGLVSLQLTDTSEIKDTSGNLIVHSSFEAYFLSSLKPLKSITITVDEQTKVYGESDPELTYSITSGVLEEGDSLVGTLTRELGEDVGSYSIISSLSNLKYDITFESANLVITQKPITITADAQSKFYGESDPELMYTITLGNLEDGDSLTGNLTRELGEDIGSYQVMSSLSNSNYEITFESADFLITSKVVEIKIDYQTKTYGEPDPEFTYSVVSGSLNEGDFLILNRELGENVGIYEITLDLSNLNYDVFFESSNLLIRSKPITISADIQSKVYGESDPELTYTITSGVLEEGDFFQGELEREQGEDIGLYLIERGSLSLGGNYDITFIENYFEIKNIDGFFSLYPNPVGDYLYIKIDEGLDINEVLVYTYLGELIDRVKNVEENFVDLKGLSSGVYLVKVCTSDSIFVGKIIKK